jgi:16S rRNA (guanine527-N7)-methyltransferase
MEIGSEEWKRVVIEGAARLGVQVDQRAAEYFARHGCLLHEWNRRVNLTAIVDPLEVAVKHFVDSIAAVDAIPPGARMLDIGSGGGFPGIPLKVLLPSITLALIDASHKKISFLKHLVRKLQLDQTEAHHINVEQLGPNTFWKGGADVIVCRAFSSMDNIIKKTLPLLSDTGAIVGFRGRLDDDEMKTVTQAAAVESRKTELRRKYILNVKRYRLPFIGGNRAIVVIKGI